MIKRTIFSFFVLFCCLSATAADTNKNTGSHKPAVIVDATKAVIKTYQPSVMSVGSLIAEQGITVKPQASGNVTKIYFQSGDYVQKGQPLIQIYPDILQAQLKSNQAALELSRLNFKRYSALYQKKATSRAEFDAAAAKLKSDEAAVQQTKAELAQTLVTASFSGRLGIRLISLGDYVQAGTTPIVNLQDVDPIFVDFTVPEKYMKQIKIGNRITISASAYGHKKFIGKVIAIDSQVNINTRTIGVRAAVPNKNQELIPGSFVEVHLDIGTPQNLVSIPQTALVYSPDGNYVFKIVDNKAVQTIIELGKRGDQDVFVTKGLSAGDVVVTAGTIKLKNGDRVQVRSSYQSLTKNNNRKTKSHVISDES